MRVICVNSGDINVGRVLSKRDCG